VILMAGLQGSGKTTTTGKLANCCSSEKRKKVLVVSCDVYRPAAIEQLKTVAAQAGVDFFPSRAGAEAGRHRARARSNARETPLPRRADRRHRRPPGDRRGDDGRDRRAARRAASPVETLFVVDAMPGQDAVERRARPSARRCR
jgi:signal recognition particle subunit SRP54